MSIVAKQLLLSTCKIFHVSVERLWYPASVGIKLVPRYMVWVPTGVNLSIILGQLVGDFGGIPPEILGRRTQKVWLWREVGVHRGGIILACSCDDIERPSSKLMYLAFLNVIFRTFM